VAKLEDGWLKKWKIGGQGHRRMERCRRNTREEERIKKLEWGKGSERRQNLEKGEM